MADYGSCNGSISGSDSADSIKSFDALESKEFSLQANCVMNPLKQCIKEMTQISSVNCNYFKYRKIFCDPVHGHIALHPACTVIIDTPQFQRLRHIKQTGFLDLVFPGASHNRFGHSLGVCYLAGKFLKEIRNRQPELNISDVDVLCVEIAGLCHDLGHGPFSHTWEEFMKQSNYLKGINCIWKHEIISIHIFDYLIKENHLSSKLASYGIGPHQISTIKQMIIGDQGVQKDRTFLYQIVNNEESGLDVDKWDYFLRDCLYLGLQCDFEYRRLLQFSRVLVVDGKKQICFRDKMLETVYNMFRTRSNLHRLAYQHRVFRVIEKMICDALLLADGKAIGPSGEILDFWGCSTAAAFSKDAELEEALEKYCRLNDSIVFNCLRYSPKPDLVRVVQILKAVEKRSCKNCGFYQLVAMKILPSKLNLDKYEVLNSLSKFLPYANAEVTKNLNQEFVHQPLELEDSTPLGIEDLDATIVSIHWGKKDKNPVEFIHFYCKNSSLAIKSWNHEESSVILPKTFEEVQLHILCCRPDDFALRVAKFCFEKYWLSFKVNHFS